MNQERIKESFQRLLNSHSPHTLEFLENLEELYEP